MEKLKLDPEAVRATPPRVMMLLKRSTNSKFTRNSDQLVRQWSNIFTEAMLQHLRISFPTYRVILLSDRNTTMMGCLPCQMRAMLDVDVLVGMHGAGLANMLYMKPNGAVVEIAPYGNDGRCLLGGGPFSRLAAVMGHNYMMHHPLYEEFTWMKDMTSEFNITRFSLHIQAFLKSIGYI